MKCFVSMPYKLQCVEKSKKTASLSSSLIKLVRGTNPREKNAVRDRPEALPLDSANLLKKVGSKTFMAISPLACAKEFALTA